MVCRTPSPFTHTDTRSTLTFDRNFTNNPVNNTGGTGLATLLLGYINSGVARLPARALRTRRRTSTALFIQDDFKLRNNITVNAGLRYEIFTPGVESEDRLANYDPVGKRFIYAGEDGAIALGQQEDAVRQLRAAPRPHVGLTGDATTVLRTGYGITYFPIAARRRQHARAAGAVRDLPELQHRDQPAQLARTCR